MAIDRNRDRRIRIVCLRLILLLATVVTAGCGQPQVGIAPNAVPERPASVFVPTDYLIGPGDQLEVLYHINPGYTQDQYKIDTQDTLRVEFFYYPGMTRTVRVRPDGVITMPLIGDVKAIGLKPEDLAKQLAAKYQPHLKRPVITVEVQGFMAKVDELKEAITTQDRGQSRLVLVRPDGAISLPYIGDIRAAGTTPGKLADQVEKEYQKYIENMEVTVAVLEARSYLAYIMGEVDKPNYYELRGPTTLLELIAMAGGFTTDANAHGIVVISRSPTSQPVARLVDMDQVLGTGNLARDIMLRQYDVVYVPRTKLSQAALTADLIWRLIPLSFSASGSYSLGGITP